MTRILAILLLSSILLQGQGLQSYITTATFTSEAGSFLEIYIGFDANTLQLRQKNEMYSGEIEIQIDITNGKKTIYNDHYILKSPNFKNIDKNNLFFFDQKRLKLSNNEYHLRLIAFDKAVPNKINEHTEKIIIDYSNKIGLSDIQLISSFTKDTTQSNKVSKGGMLLTPFASNYYPKNINAISYYFEEYNTDQMQGNRYLLKTYIETYQTKTPLFNFNKSIRKKGEKFLSNILEFNISDLPTGNYNLVCELRNSMNQTIIKKKIFFQRSNSITGYNNEDINAVSITGTFTETIADKDLLKLYIDYLYPISSPDENTFAQNQLRYDDISLMQKFFYNFWKKRNTTNPKLAWDEYHNKVKAVNKDFKNFRIPGYLTDRGRVYLQYGAPNSIHNVENASSNYPYEIWHYYKLNTQANKKFVFVNADFATNEYRLEYSNVYGEVSNAEWRDKIEQSKSPTFGDDFNNNYINPR